MRFQRLDLNLLVALDALLSERSVSLAALCSSQADLVACWATDSEHMPVRIICQ